MSDERKGPLFCDTVPDPKRYLTAEEINGLQDDKVDWLLTIQTRGKKYCDWELGVPDPKPSGLVNGPR